MKEKNSLEITLISDEYNFELLRNEWDKLLLNSQSNCIFLTWEWLFSWWKSFKEHKKLLLIIARDNGALVGIAPLYLETVNFFGIKPLRHIEFLGSTNTCSEYLDFIIEKGKEAELFPLFLDQICIVNLGIKWDVLNLVAMDEGSVNKALLGEYCKNRNIKYDCYDTRYNPYIKLPETLDDYLKRISSDKRRKFRSYKRRLEQEKEMKIVVVGPSEHIPTRFKEFVTLHQKRWIEKNGHGSFSPQNKNFLEFHNEIAALFHNKDWLYLVFLMINNEIAAAVYCFKYDNSILAYSSGFDIKWEAYQVGSVLMLCLIEEAINNRFADVDLLRGSEPYKFFWTKTTKQTVDIVVWKSGSLRQTVKFERIIRRFFKSLLPKGLSFRLYRAFFLRRM